MVNLSPEQLDYVKQNKLTNHKMCNVVYISKIKLLINIIILIILFKSDIFQNASLLLIFFPMFDIYFGRRTIILDYGINIIVLENKINTIDKSMIKVFGIFIIINKKLYVKNKNFMRML